MIFNILSPCRTSILLNKSCFVIKQIIHAPNRPFFQWLNIVFNQIDHKRVQDVGIERVCAEWLLRNGASVKWAGSSKYLRDYNGLPKETERFNIVEVEACGASISHYGFIHFNGCNFIKKVVLHDCGYIEDEALKQLKFLSNSIEDLQVSMCGNITDNGIRYIKDLSKLKNLELFKLHYVKEKQALVEELQAFLPKCHISFDNLDGSYYNEAYKLKKRPIEKKTAL